MKTYVDVIVLNSKDGKLKPLAILWHNGIKYSIDRDVTTSKIHIMGDFRLKFFELGTKKRFKRNK